MPEICRFLGIVIYMLYDDHRPPHFHAEYGEYKVTVEINSGVADCLRSVVLEQVTNGLAVRMAVLFLVNGGKGPQEISG